MNAGGYRCGSAQRRQAAADDPGGCRGAQACGTGRGDVEALRRWSLAGERASDGTDGLSLKMGGGRVVELDPRKHPHLDHGYAMTRSSQGQTANGVLIHANTELSARICSIAAWPMLLSRYAITRRWRVSSRLCRDRIASSGPPSTSGICRSGSYSNCPGKA
jgi:hypothetical protein